MMTLAQELADLDREALEKLALENVGPYDYYDLADSIDGIPTDRLIVFVARFMKTEAF